MKHESIRQLFDYWNERRGTREAPERSDIEPGAIRRALADTFILGFAKIGMHEIAKRTIINISKKRMRSSLMNPVPAHVWHNQLLTEAPHTSSNQAETTCLAKLIRLFKQHLHSDANP